MQFNVMYGMQYKLQASTLTEHNGKVCAVHCAARVKMQTAKRTLISMERGRKVKNWAHTASVSASAAALRSSLLHPFSQ